MSQEDVIVQVDVMGSKEIDLGKKTKEKKRRQRVDDYDYNDPLIEPFEGEGEMVMIECSLQDFFVYKGELPYSARRVLGVHSARKAREQSKVAKDADSNASPPKDKTQEQKAKRSPETKAPVRRKRGKIPKGDLKACDYLASLMKLEADRLRESAVSRDDEVEFHAYSIALEVFEREREPETAVGINPDDITKPSEDEKDKYLRERRPRIERLLDMIAEDARSHALYSRNLSLFKGFRKEEFLFNVSEYFLLFIRTSLLSRKDLSFNGARREAYANILSVFPTTCKNSTQAQYYLLKYISQTRGVKNIFGNDEGKDDDEAPRTEEPNGSDDDVSSNLEKVE